MVLTEGDDQAENRLVAAAIERLARDWRDAPDLDALAAQAGLSPGHFQRVFKRWAGISPKRFQQFVTLGHARRLLREAERPPGLLDAALDLGLSGPSRLHDLFVTCEAMTPGEYQAGASGLEIRYAFHDCALGRVLMAATARGVCWLSFTGEGEGAEQAYGVQENLRQMRAQWPGARFIEDAAATRPALDALLGRGDGQGGSQGDRRTLSVHVKGTNFQIKVWQALLAIPHGAVASYEDVARAVGRPTAMRAVGNAVGANPVSWLIPCHRVIRKTGVLDNYRWGPTRKRSLLAWEAARDEF